MQLLGSVILGMVMAVPPGGAIHNHHPKAPPPHVGGKTNHAKPKNVRPLAGKGHAKHPLTYHTRHGLRFRHGYYYKGWNHNHWSRHYWDTRYGCYLYLDPGVNTYYYWCAPHYAFYPVTYVPVGLGYAYPFDPNPQPPAEPPPAPPPIITLPAVPPPAIPPLEVPPH